VASDNIGIDSSQELGQVKVSQLSLPSNYQLTLLEDANLIKDPHFLLKVILHSYLFENRIIICSPQIDNINPLAVFGMHRRAEHVNKVRLTDIPAVDGIYFFRHFRLWWHGQGALEDELTTHVSNLD